MGPLLAAAQPLLPLLGTMAAYEAGLRLQRRLGGAAWANPVLIAVTLVATVLAISGAPAERYLAGVQPLTLLLGPATVALAVPLYRSLPQLRAAWGPVLVTVGTGAVAATVTALGVVDMLGAPAPVVHAMATKTVTAAVAVVVAGQIGSDPALAAGIAVLTGIAGAVICTAALDWGGVHDERARGLAAGTAASGIGTARMLAVSPVAGAFASLAMSLTGLLGGTLLPVCLAHWAR